MSEVQSVAVIGGGVSGLACAHRLLELQKGSQKKFRIVLLEAGPRLGGIIETEKKDGFILEKGPDAFLREKPWALDLARRLGLEGELIGTRETERRSFVVQKGKLLPVPEGFYLISPVKILSFLASPVFSLSGKLRMLTEPLVRRRSSQEDESVGDFVRRRFGNECFERMGQAMLGGVYTGDPDALSTLATVGRFRELENKYGSVLLGLRKEKVKASGPRYGLFVSFKGGMQTLTDALVQNIPFSVMRLGTVVEKASYDAVQKSWRLSTREGETFQAQAVCCTLPARSTQALLKEDSPELAQELFKLRYESVATVNLAYRESQMPASVRGAGFVVPRTENRAIVACTFVDRKFEGRVPEGFRLLRAFVGGAFGREIYKKNDAQILSDVEKDLKELLGIQGEPQFHLIQRYPEAMVQYGVGHLDWFQGVERRLESRPGFFLAGSSYRGVGIPDCVREAEAQAEKIVQYLN